MKLTIRIENENEFDEVSYDIPDTYFSDAKIVLMYIRRGKYLSAGKLLWKLLRRAKLV